MQNQTPHPMPFYTIEAQTDLEIGLIEEFKRVLSRVREYSSTKENAALLRKNYSATVIENCMAAAFQNVINADGVPQIKSNFYDAIAYCLMLSALANEPIDGNSSNGDWAWNNENIQIAVRNVQLVSTGTRIRKSNNPTIKDAVQLSQELHSVRDAHQKLKDTSTREILALQKEVQDLQRKLKRSEDARVDAHNKFEFAQDKLESMFNELARSVVSLARAERKLVTLRDKLARYERKEQEEAVNSFKQDNAARLLLAKKPTPADLYGTIKSEVQLNEDGAISGFGMASTTTEKLSITADSFDVRLVACANKLDALANRVNNVIERKE